MSRSLAANRFGRQLQATNGKTDGDPLHRQPMARYQAPLKIRRPKAMRLTLRLRIAKTRVALPVKVWGLIEISASPSSREAMEQKSRWLETKWKPLRKLLRPARGLSKKAATFTTPHVASPFARAEKRRSKATV